MANYANGKIYKIVSGQTDRVYIGATVNALSVRLAQHRTAAKAHFAGTRGRMTSFDVVQFDDATIELIEAYPCENVEQLRVRERYWIENTPNRVNRNIPGRTDAEYHADNREAILLRQKAYYIAHKEVMNAQSAAYRAANKEHLARWQAIHYEKNGDRIRARGREFYQANADALKARQARVIVCECGLNTTVGSKSNHRKSKVHALRMGEEPGLGRRALAQQRA